MKKSLLYLLICFNLYSTSNFAQIKGFTSFGYYFGFGYSFDNLIYEENNLKDENKKNSIKQKTITKNLKTTAAEIIYDTSGYVKEYNSPSKKKRLKIFYYKGNLKNEYTLYKKGEIVIRDSYNYEGNKLIGRYRVNKHNIITHSEQYKYDSSYVTEFLYKKT